jgi:hypothetical protein
MATKNQKTFESVFTKDEYKKLVAMLDVENLGGIVEILSKYTHVNDLIMCEYYTFRAAIYACVIVNMANVVH